MFRLNNTKQNVLIVALATLLTGCGGGGTATSTDSTSTDLTATSTPKVVTVQISEPITTEDSATIEWVPFADTTTLVEYGTSKQYGSEVLVQIEGTITLYNLQAGTEYHYRIVAEDQNGRQVVSRDQTFTTNLAPIVTEPTPTDPIITEPAPTDPIVTEPVPTDPIVTEPAPTDPIITEPIPTDPIVTEPAPTDPIVTDPIVTEPAPICQNGPATQQGQVKDSISGIGLADVTVTINGCITQTDANGYYTLNNIIENDKAVVNFEKVGYLRGSSQIQIRELSENGTNSPNYLEFSMNAYSQAWNNGRVWTYETQNGATGGEVEIPAGLIHTDSKGNIYSGTVSAHWVFKDTMTKEGRDAFPGSFNGINTNGVLVPFVSYGLISLEIDDGNGTSLSAEGTITLSLNSITGTNENILPLWYYDYDQGTWIEEGYAELQTDGTYRADISHTGTWSISQPMEQEVGIYRGSIVDEAGAPMSNVRIKAIGTNWSSSDLSTDADGVFEIEVIPGNDFQLAAYDYKNKFGANYNGIIVAIASGAIVEE